MRSKRLLSYEEFRQLVRRAVKLAGSQKELADQLGVSGAYISDVLSGRRMPSRRLLTALGCQRVTLYQVPDGKELA